MFSFALKTLLSDRGKLLTGVAGVVFSLVLVHLQGGLYFGLRQKASLLIDHGDADLWVGHRHVENVDLAREIPEAWAERLRGVPGVVRAEPYIVGKGTASLSSGRMEDVWVIGSPPASMAGSAWSFVEGSVEALRRPDGISFDDVDAEKLDHPRLGDRMEVNGRRAIVVARTHGITGFITMPYLFTTYETARRMSRLPSGACSFLLVRLKPDADRAKTIAEVRRRVPEASVRTPAEFARLSQDYWMKRTGIGLSFGASTALGLLVGLLMVAQSLYALALDHLTDYATLKALGADDRQVSRVIFSQALTIATLGSICGLSLVAAIAARWNSPLAPLAIPSGLVVAAVAVVYAICLAAVWLPFARIRRLDPALVLLE